jgi:tetratricopeptide (TPR) repeat protein
MKRFTRFDKDLARIYADLDRGAVERALKEAARLNAGNPGEPEAILALAHAQRAAGSFEEAAAGAGRAKRLLPDDPEPVLLEAESLTQLDRFAGALEVLDQASPACREDPYLIALEVEVLAQLKRRKDLPFALRRLEAASVSGEDIDDWCGRLDDIAGTLSHRGFRDEAARVGRLADALDGIGLEDEEDEFEGEPIGRPVLRSDAIIIVDAIREKPDLLRTLIEGESGIPGLGEKEGREDPAAIAFVDVVWRWIDSDAALVRMPEGAGRDLRKAVERVNAGDAVAARQLAERARASEPENVTAMEVLGHAAALRGNYAKALEWLTRAAGISSSDAALHAHRACAAAMAGRSRLALEAMEASLAACGGSGD